MTSNNNTEVGALVSSTGSTGTVTNLRQAVRNVDLKAMQVVNNKTILQARTTKVRVQQAAIFVLKNFHKDGVDNQPATCRIYKLAVKKTGHTGNHHERRSRSSRKGGSTRKAWGHRNRMRCGSTSCTNVTKAGFTKLHAGKKLISTGSRNSFRARGSSTSRTCIGILNSLLKAREIAKNVSIKLVTQTISSPV